MRTLSIDEVLEAARSEEREFVHVERSGDRAVVWLDDPGKLNVLSGALTWQLREALATLALEDGLRSIVLTGTDPGFSTGGDLRLMDNAVRRIHSDEDEDGAVGPWRFIRYQFGAIVRLIARTDKAFIAAVNGPAAGVGLAFALNCDIVLASERAVLVPAFGRLGLLPEVGTSWTLTRRLGYQGAFRYYVTGEHVTAAQALELGLVSEVVPHAELLSRAEEWCDRVSAMPRHALEMTKPLLRSAADLPWEQSLVTEEFAEPSCFTTRAFADSVTSLLQK